MSDQQIFGLAEQVGRVLTAAGHKLGLAESCTGGWVSQTVTDVAGSSAWFECGIVTYSNQAKHQLLGVPNNILSNLGAVSEACVRAMVAGVLNNSTANCAASVSGIAGPGGATRDKPVGTVWFAWQLRNGSIVVSKQQFGGDRRAVRAQSVICVLQGILDLYREP